MQLCIFEGIDYNRLEPLIYSRPVYDMICGINSLRKKILRAYPGVKYSLHCRPYLEHFVRVKNPGIEVNKIEDDKCLLLNGKIIAPPNLAEIIPLEGEDKLYKCGDAIIAARVSGKKLDELKLDLYDLLSESNFGNLPVEKVDIPFCEYVWNLVQANASQLRCDFEHLMNETGNNNNIRGKVHEGAYLVEKDNIYIEEGAVIKPGAVLDASDGPIYIDRNAVVASNAVIEGAVYLGENSIIRSCSRVYEDVSIGATCKIGGEVEDSVILPFTNKQHSGFLGHAYLGSWVNIGADTNCSDLKNNYGTVRVYTDGQMVDSGLQFLGVIIGDHTKTAINTMFNTGTIVGFCCNIFGPGFPDKYLPSFSWGGSEAVTTYDLERSIETAKRMLQRRNREMSEPEEKLFRKIFDITKTERRKRGYPY